MILRKPSSLITSGVIIDLPNRDTFFLVRSSHGTVRWFLLNCSRFSPLSTIACNSRITALKIFEGNLVVEYNLDTIPNIQYSLPPIPYSKDINPFCSFSVNFHGHSGDYALAKYRSRLIINCVCVSLAICQSVE